MLGFIRGMMYSKSHPISQNDLDLMTELDRFHMEFPFMGTCMLVNQLTNRGFSVGRTHVRTLTQRMGIHAIYRKPRTSGQHPQHKKYPAPEIVNTDQGNQFTADEFVYTVVNHDCKISNQ